MKNPKSLYFRKSKFTRPCPEAAREYTLQHYRKVCDDDLEYVLKDRLCDLSDVKIPGDPVDVLTEAFDLTSGDRQNQYGPSDQDFARTAAMWGALKGVEFTTEDVAAFLICVKLSRNTHQAKRDNWVDVAGYARCGDICRQEKEKRDGK